MYSDKENILQLVALLREHGITQVVVCPGSRNSPLAHSFASCSSFSCYSVTDERSAGFFAIGRALACGKPAVVCCTSGSALLNLHPAVAEAYYQRVPLIVVSADRPAAWIGQMDGQTLPQPGVFAGLVKLSVQLPEIHTEEDKWYCNRLVNEALLETDHHGRGPVHINVPLSEPLFRFTSEELPAVRVIKRLTGHDEEMDELACLYASLPKRLVIAGQMDEYTDEMMFRRVSEGDNPDFLGDTAVCLAEHLANRKTPCPFLGNFDALLYAMPEEEREAMSPDLVITYGGHIVSKRLKQFLRKFRPKEHWHIAPDGRVADVFGCLTKVIETVPSRFFYQLGSRLQAEDEESRRYVQSWADKGSRIPVPRFPYSEMAAIGELMQRQPAASVLHLGNSSAVRYAQLFPLSNDFIEVHCNRGTSGIEGSLSAAMGYAVQQDRMDFIVTGDLSFFYDMNALWNKPSCEYVRILLLNNGGGEIFHALPGLQMSDRTRQLVAATHHTSAEGWARTCGFDYISVNNQQELEDGMKKFTAWKAASRPMLMEVFTDPAEDTRLLKEYYHSLKNKQ